MALNVEQLAVVRAGGAIPGHSDARRAWSAREGLLVVLRSGAHVGLGEASPLPGYSRETLEACAREAASLDPTTWPSIDPHAPLVAVRSVIAPIGCPALAFAVETALLDLAGTAAGLPLRAYYGDGAHRVALCALLDAREPDLAATAARRAVERGVGAVKLKIGGSAAQDLALSRAVRDAIGPGARLRLDANGALGDDVVARCASLASLQPELIEEPTVARLLVPLAIPVALDESLADAQTNAPKLVRDGLAAHLILKPMLLGGVLRCLELAAACGAPFTVSHLVDGPVALAAYASFACARGGALAGLDRHAGLAAWPDVHVPHVSRTHVEPCGLPGIGIDREALLAAVRT